MERFAGIGPVIRYSFTVILAGIFAVLLWASEGSAKRVVILGIDGMDPELLERFVAEGVMPNFRQFMTDGYFRRLQTSMPPLSPVAWSTFITGMDPGGHGIFDFLHRRKGTMIPELSMSKVMPPTRKLEIGSWVIPLSGGSVELLRKGTAFWQILEHNGVPTTVFRMPSNFPPAPCTGKAFSGMGTPDILGTSGTFSYFTTDPPANAKSINGGIVYEVRVANKHVKARLKGPPNTFRREKTEKGNYRNPDLWADFDVYLDPEDATAKFVIQDSEFALKQGEWSDWVRVDFEAVPVLAGISSIGRFYLQEVSPEFRLYVSPLQINPEEPALPLSNPEEWSHELFEQLGYFYTQELPEDTKAFSGGIFDGHEFWEQSQFVYRERRRALDYFLERYQEGLLFFYFSSVDQGSHMLWRYMDEDHPAYQQDEQLANGLRTIYREMDEALGKLRASISPDTVLIVMSDHGFAPFYRGVNLNSWLFEQGYVTLKNPARRDSIPLFLNVDWAETKAYALGLNGLYVNLAGREPNGIVSDGAERQQVLDGLEKGLLALKDPETGEQAISLVLRTHKDFHGPYTDAGPDIIVGYNRGYRSSWESPLGEFPRSIFVDNFDPWSGDHSMDYRQVPGVLISNREILLDQPALYDLTVAILDEYGVEKTPEMIGRDCLANRDRGE